MSRLLPYPDLETACLSFDIFHFTIGKQFYVRVLADSNKLRREDARGAIVGREGLVKLGHAAADSCFVLYQIYFKARLSQVQRCLNAGDTATYDESRAYHVIGLGHGPFTFR